MSKERFKCCIVILDHLMWFLSKDCYFDNLSKLWENVIWARIHLPPTLQDPDPRDEGRPVWIKMPTCEQNLPYDLPSLTGLIRKGNCDRIDFPLPPPCWCVTSTPFWNPLKNGLTSPSPSLLLWTPHLSPPFWKTFEDRINSLSPFPSTLDPHWTSHSSLPSVSPF